MQDLYLMEYFLQFFHPSTNSHIHTRHKHVHTDIASIAAPSIYLQAFDVCPNIHIKKDIFKAVIVYNLWNIIIYFWDPRGHYSERCMCAYVCLCIFICLEPFHVSFRDLHPPNSSLHLLITKILPCPVSCRYFSLLFPGCCLLPALLQKLTAAVYYWSTLTSISAYKGMSHQNTQTDTNTVLELFTHTNTLLHKWQKNRHTPYAFFSTSCCFCSDNHGYAPQL